MDEINEFQNERTLLAHERTRLANERNRMANERTFLSWIRTGLAMVGGGIAIIRFLTFSHIEHKYIANSIGVILIVLGIIMFFLSSLDYWSSARQLKVKNGYAGSSWSVTLIALTLVIISLLLILILAGFEYQNSF